MNSRLFALLAFALMLAVSAGAKSFYFPQVNAEYKFNEDASINVKEELTFNFSGNFTFAYREIPRQGSEKIENFKVFEKTPEGLKELQPSISYSPFKATWYYSALNEQKTFVLEYTLKNAVKSYDDAFEFYWKLWGDYWDASVQQFNAVMNFPKPLAQGSKVWVHPALDGSWNLEGKKLQIEARNIPKRTFLEARILFNKEVMSETFAERKSGSVFQKAESEESFNEIMFGAKRFLWIVPVIVLFVLAFFFRKYYKLYGTEPKVQEIKYFRDIPFDDKPYLVDYLMNMKITPNGMSATLMDLVRRKHIKIEKVKKKGIIAGFLDQEDYKLSLLKSNDALTNPEKKLLSLVFGKQNINDLLAEEFTKDDDSEILLESTTLSEISERQKKVSTSLFERWKSVAETNIETNKTKNNFFDFTGQKKFTTVLLIVGVITFALNLILSPATAFIEIWAIMFVGPLILLLANAIGAKRIIASILAFFLTAFAMLITLVALSSMLAVFEPFTASFFVILAFVAIIVLFPRALPSMTMLGAEHYSKWNALKRYFDDFKYLREKTPTDIVLWEQYLVFATVFGNAEKVLKEFKLPFSASKVQDSTHASFIAFSSPSFYHSFNSGFNSAGFSSAHASGSGGFSGGGGGGGGGGGAG